MINTILQGNVLQEIKKIPDESVDCIITSPPYYGLRNYGNKDQIGLESSYHDYLAKLRLLMNEHRRVLKSTGTCWIVINDTYVGMGGPSRHFGYKDPKYGNNKGGYFIEPQSLDQGISAKCLMGIPERFFIQCIDDGWIARNKITWIKNNAMPNPVKDRFSNKTEQVLFFAKNKKYYFDLDKVREQPKNSNFSHSKGKNPGDCFFINNKPYRGAHFATFPLELPLKILKCACPKNGIVLDPFFGSGTTAVAAKKLGLNWLGIELNKDYIRIAKERIHNNIHIVHNSCT